MKKFLLLLFAMITTFSFSAVELDAKRPAAEPVEYDWTSEEVQELCWEEDSCEVDLWAGQHILAGSILVSIENGYLFIDVLTDHEYDEVHIGVYNELPVKRPAPGQMEFDPNHQYQIGDQFFLIVHVAFSEVTGGDVSGETAYGGATQTGNNAWFYYIPIRVVECDPGPEDPPGELGSETAWALYRLNFDTFDEYGIQRWGWTNYLMDNRPYELELWAGAGQNDLSKGTHVGTVLALPNPDGTWNIDYIAFPGFMIEEVHLYMGVEPLPGVPMTAAPGQFPYIIDGIYTPFVAVHTGVHPAPVYLAAHAVVTGNYPEE